MNGFRITTIVCLLAALAVRADASETVLHERLLDDGVTLKVTQTIATQSLTGVIGGTQERTATLQIIVERSGERVVLASRVRDLPEGDSMYARNTVFTSAVKDGEVLIVLAISVRMAAWRVTRDAVSGMSADSMTWLDGWHVDARVTAPIPEEIGVGINKTDAGWEVSIQDRRVTPAQLWSPARYRLEDAQQGDSAQLRRPERPGANAPGGK